MSSRPDTVLPKERKRLEVLNISRQYRRRAKAFYALKDVSLRLDSPLTMVVGPNGSGKSTLLKIAATAENASSGELVFEGKPLQGAAMQQYRLRMGYVPQDVHFIDSMSCGDTLAYAAWMTMMPRGLASRRIAECLELVGLQDSADNRTGALSGGQNRRLGIAAALIHEPSLLIIDEPTAGLDPSARLSVRQVLMNVSSKARVLMSTHLTDDIEVLATKVHVLLEGSTAFHGDWSALKSQTSLGSALSGDALERALTTLSVEKSGSDSL